MKIYSSTSVRPNAKINVTVRSMLATLVGTAGKYYRIVVTVISAERRDKNNSGEHRVRRKNCFAKLSRFESCASPKCHGLWCVTSLIMWSKSSTMLITVLSCRPS